MQRALGQLAAPPRTFAASGAGIGLMGATLWEATGRQAKYLWYAEGVDAADRAHVAMWEALRERPARYTRAELTGAEGAPHADAELLSLRCAPFSAANRSFPEGIWAAIAELIAVLTAVFARQPRIIIYENSAGMLRQTWVRAAVERALTRDPAYTWELAVACPEK